MGGIAFNFAGNSTRARVEDWCICFENQIFEGEGIETMIDALKKNSGDYWDLDLNHRGKFIIDYLLRQGFRFRDAQYPNAGEFCVLCSAASDIFQIAVCFKKSHKKGQTIYFNLKNASKKLLGDVKNICDAFYCPYDATKSPIFNEARAVDKSIRELRKRGLTGLTLASDALNAYKQTVGQRIYNQIFTEIPAEVEENIRQAYAGGLCMLGQDIAGKELSNVNVFDINSAYPYQMATKALPYGEPLYFTGTAPLDPLRPLFIIHVEACFSLKPSGVPFVLSQKWFETSYITDTAGCMLSLWLTSCDLDLLYENYSILDIKFIEGYQFRASEMLFNDYVMPLYEKKSAASAIQREISKLLLNGLYGKLAARSTFQNLRPDIQENIVNWTPEKTIHRTASSSIATSAFITAYQRRYLINAIKANLSRFAYCDTDSVHLIGDDVPSGVTLNEKAIGAFKHEQQFSKITYFKPKMYAGVRPDGTEKICLSGIPKINTNTIKYIDIVQHKNIPITRPITVSGGITLTTTLGRPLSPQTPGG